MSIKVLSYVWEHSHHKGSHLLLLLAIADFADDAGFAYPSVPRLARKARMTDRNVQYALTRLIASRELAYQPLAGPNGTHLYQVLMHYIGQREPWGENFAPHEDGKERSYETGGENFSPLVQSFRGEAGFTPTVRKKEDLKKDMLQEDLQHVPGESLRDVPQADADTPPVATQTRKTKPIEPLDPDDWLYKLLEEYAEDFDLVALNDNKWWTDLANSFPVFDRDWMSRAFADLAEWLSRNPARRPRNARGWKQRMKFSLNYFYDRDQRRHAYGPTTHH